MKAFFVSYQSLYLLQLSFCKVREQFPGALGVCSERWGIFSTQPLSWSRLLFLFCHTDFFQVTRNRVTSAAIFNWLAVTGTLKAFKTRTSTFRAVAQNGNNVIAIESKQAWLETCTQDIEIHSSLMRNSHLNNSLLFEDIVSLEQTKCCIQTQYNSVT